MAKGKFSDIGAKATSRSQKDFISGAKVDGDHEKPSRMRRGRTMKDPVTGQRVKLRGKVLEVPLNEVEYRVFRQAAEKAGLPVATYVRTTILGINNG